MKRKSLLPVLGMVLLASSCKKDKDQPDPQDTPDPGIYDPESWFPMKMGAYWVYQHESGFQEVIECGALKEYSDYSATTQSSYPYKAHELSSNFPYDQLPDIEPRLNGRYTQDGRRPNAAECHPQGNLVHLNILDPSFVRWQYFPRNKDCPEADPEIVLCLETDAKVGSFSGVRVYAITRASNIVNLNSGSGTYIMDEQPVFKEDAVFSISWYARGVGLVRREIYENGELMDRMFLTSYSFTQ